MAWLTSHQDWQTCFWRCCSYHSAAALAVSARLNGGGWSLQWLLLGGGCGRTKSRVANSNLATLGNNTGAAPDNSQANLSSGNAGLNMPGFDQQQQQQPQTSAAGSRQRASTSLSPFGQSSASIQAAFGQQQPFGAVPPFNIGQSATSGQAASGHQQPFGAALPFNFGPASPFNFDQSAASSQTASGQQQPFGAAPLFNIGQSAAPSQAASGQQQPLGAAPPVSFGQSAAGGTQSGTAPFSAAQQPRPPLPAPATQQPAPQSSFVFGPAPVNGQAPLGAQPAAGKHLAVQPRDLPCCRPPMR